MQSLQELPKDVRFAVNEFRNGRFVLLHDSQSRENEVDLVVAGEMTTPEHVRTMRQNAGGLICVALAQEVGKQLGLGYLHDIFDVSSVHFPILRELAEAREPYGDRPAFSITVNHRRTFTGVTDQDRALTICQLGKLSKKILRNQTDCRLEFANQFRAPGHVYLLLESDGGLNHRRGHTELSLYLCRLAGITPAAAICEMLDGKTYRALTADAARSYAQEHRIPMIDGEILLKHCKSKEQESVQ